jgi:hypothetical protein
MTLLGKVQIFELQIINPQSSHAFFTFQAYFRTEIFTSSLLKLMMTSFILQIFINHKLH